MHDYELFSMKDFESIVKIVFRFMAIVNELEALGNTYTEVEKVKKILRSLPKKWETKVTVIQEAKDVTKLPLEELIGSLMNNEIKLNNHQRVEENKKSIAFMTSTNDDEEEESENENFDLITKKFMKSIKLEKINERRKSHSNEESSSAKKNKKAMVATWSESESDEDSMEEECTNEDANMCLWLWRNMKMW